MKNWRFTIILAGSMVLALALAATAGAQGRMRRAGMNNSAADGFGIRQFVNNLQLTQAQREDIKAILKSHQPEILVLREDCLKARIGILNKDPNAPAGFGTAQTKIMALKETIAGEIEAKLTADQLSKLQNARQLQANRLSQRLQRLEQR